MNRPSGSNGRGSNQYRSRGVPTVDPATRTPVPQFTDDDDTFADNASEFARSCRTWRSFNEAVTAIHEAAADGYIPPFTVTNITYDYRDNDAAMQTNVEFTVTAADGTMFTVEAAADPHDPDLIEMYIPKPSGPGYDYANGSDVITAAGMTDPPTRGYARMEAIEAAFTAAHRLASSTLEDRVRDAARQEAAAITHAWELAEPATTPGQRPTTYFVRDSDTSGWRQVTLHDYLRQERAAGFHGNGRSPATAGFSGGSGSSGAVDYSGRGLDEFIKHRQSIGLD